MSLIDDIEQAEPGAKDEVVGCTFGKADPQKSTAILIDEDVGLFDFLRIDDTLTQVKAVVIKSDVSVEDAREIAYGNEVARKHDVHADLEIIGKMDGIIMDKPQPIMPGSKIYLATSEQVAGYLGFVEGQDTIRIGDLKRRADIPVVMRKDWFSKHISIMGMTGAGKSNLSKVILSAMRKVLDVPIVIIDPHGEYTGDILSIDTMDCSDYTNLDPNIVVEKMHSMMNESQKIKLNELLSYAKVVQRQHKTNGTQAIIECCKDVYVRGASLIRPIVLEAIKQVNIEQTISGRLKTIKGKEPLVINLKGVPAEIGEAVVLSVIDKVLEMGKAGKPIITFIDEVHNYCPQKRKAKSKNAIITLLSEGRKFGCGVVIASQRPAKVDKDAISQCNTKFCLKLTNENDIRQVRSSTEYSTKQMFQEVQKLQVGECLLTSPWINRPVFIRIERFVED